MRPSQKQTIRSMLQGAVVFFILQQTAICLFSSPVPECPEHNQDGGQGLRLNVKHEGKQTAESTNAPVSDDDHPRPKKLQFEKESMDDAQLPQGHHDVVPRLHNVETHLEDEQQPAPNPHKRTEYLHNRLRFAGPGDCVSVREVAEYYCGKEDENEDCAKSTDDCEHLVGCVSCKAGSSVFWPEDKTNCLKCEKGFSFKDSGFEDCTGVCTRDISGIEDPAQKVASNPWSYSSMNTSFYNPVNKHKAWDACTHITPSINVKLDQAKKDGSAFVVMVTTIGNSSDKDKQLLQLAAASSWDVLQPGMITLVAVDAHDVPAPRDLPRIHCAGNPAGTPYVTNLFVAAEKNALRAGATFAGFSNGDIAYDETLFFTLTKIAKSIEKNEIKKRVVVIGRRLNIDSALDNAEDLIRSGDPDSNEINGNTRERRQRYRASLVKASKKRRNKWMTSLAEDFFFFTPGTFDWDKMPNFVIGRVGWDSFLTQLAVDNPDIEVVDASKMIHAGHLTGDDGNAAGWMTNRPDKLWNYCALHHACVTNQLWSDRCKTCFRCGLGSLEQTNLKMVRSEKSQEQMTSASDYYALTKRHQDTEGPAEIRAKSSTILKRFGVHPVHVDKFIARIHDNTTACEETANCCSISGSAAVEYELGMRWQVRAEWPVNGKYPHETVE